MLVVVSLKNRRMLDWSVFDNLTQCMVLDCWYVGFYQVSAMVSAMLSATVSVMVGAKVMRMVMELWDV